MKRSAAIAWIGAFGIVGTFASGATWADSTASGLLLAKAVSSTKVARPLGRVILHPRPLPPRVIPPPPPPVATAPGGPVTGPGMGKMETCNGDCSDEQSASKQDGSLFMAYDVFVVVEGGIRLPPDLE